VKEINSKYRIPVPRWILPKLKRRDGSIHSLIRCCLFHVFIVNRITASSAVTVSYCTLKQGWDGMSTDLNLFRLGVSNFKILQIFLAICDQVQNPYTNVSFFLV
jgi:hypothetical protein